MAWYSWLGLGKLLTVRSTACVCEPHLAPGFRRMDPYRTSGLVLCTEYFIYTSYVGYVTKTIRTFCICPGSVVAPTPSALLQIVLLIPKDRSRGKVPNGEHPFPRWHTWYVVILHHRMRHDSRNVFPREHFLGQDTTNGGAMRLCIQSSIYICKCSAGHGIVPGVSPSENHQARGLRGVGGNP